MYLINFGGGMQKIKRDTLEFEERFVCSEVNLGIGFRNFVMFKVSLLDKQSWQIWTQLDCLLARVLKARYFLY